MPITAVNSALGDIARAGRLGRSVDRRRALVAAMREIYLGVNTLACAAR